MISFEMLDYYKYSPVLVINSTGIFKYNIIIIKSCECLPFYDREIKKIRIIREPIFRGSR